MEIAEEIVLAVTAPTPPTAPVVPKVEMAPTHGGGQTEITGSGNTGHTGTNSGSTGQNASIESGKNGRENSFGTKTNETSNGKASDGAKTDSAQKNQEQQQASESAETKDVSEALQLPVASTETQTQTQQGFQYPPEDNHSVLGTYWPFLLVFAAALIFFMYRNYQKSHTVEIKKPVTLRELLEQEEAGRPAEKTEAAVPPEKPEVKKNGGHIEIRV